MEPITITTNVAAPITKVWECWNEPGHVTNWAFASDDWAAEGIENNLEVGGHFKTRMYAKDGSAEFDFEGTYTAIEPEQHIAYVMADGRTVSIDFAATDDSVHITESFDPEAENPIEMQQEGWQAILDSFKKYVESQS